MSRPVQIALIGEFNAEALAHQAIPPALKLAGANLGTSVEAHWTPTDSITTESDVAGFDGLWCVPASPYRSLKGALLAIRYARMNARPFLGTCGGFQHLILEYAQSVLGWADAEHGELAPQSPRAVIAPLACSMVEVEGAVRFATGSRFARAYDSLEATEGYHCRYGLNPAFAAKLTAGPLRAVAWDGNGEVRGVELDAHPFFVGSLFQPERAALTDRIPPIVQAFVEAILRPSAVST